MGICRLDRCEDLVCWIIEIQNRTALRKISKMGFVCLMSSPIHSIFHCPQNDPSQRMFKVHCSGTAEIRWLSYDVGFICSLNRMEKHFRGRASRGRGGMTESPLSVEHFWQTSICCSSLFIQMPGLWESKLWL